MHAFASHVQHSFNYTHQLQQATAFYQGEARGQESARELIGSYGVHWVVAPTGSSAAIRYFDRPPAAGEIGALPRVYEIPGNQLKPYHPAWPYWSPKPQKPVASAGWSWKRKPI